MNSLDTRDGRNRITIEVPKEVKDELVKLPHGIRGKVLGGICERLADCIASKGWDNVLWLSHGKFSFSPLKEGSDK